MSDQLDLVELAGGPMLTPAQRRKLGQKRTTPLPTGHVWKPGTGPEGETCGSCLHLYRRRMAKTYLKCGLNQAMWSGGGKTDVRARDAACKKWESSLPPAVDPKPIDSSDAPFQLPMEG